MLLLVSPLLAPSSVLQLKRGIFLYVLLLLADEDDYHLAVQVGYLLFVSEKEFYWDSQRFLVVSLALVA